MKKKFNIFIHSPYRSGSTYLFSVFRKNKKINCFYEIYNEVISLKNQNNLLKENSKLWDSRHNLGNKNVIYYFSEYKDVFKKNDFIKNRQKYFKKSKKVSSYELKYLKLLTKKNNKNVLFNTGNIDKINQLSRYFKKNIYLNIRNPFSHFLSILNQANNKNFYFLRHYINSRNSIILEKKTIKKIFIKFIDKMLTTYINCLNKNPNLHIIYYDNLNKKTYRRKISEHFSKIYDLKINFSNYKQEYLKGIFRFVDRELIKNINKIFEQKILKHKKHELFLLNLKIFTFEKIIENSLENNKNSLLVNLFKK